MPGGGGRPLGVGDVTRDGGDVGGPVEENSKGEDNIGGRPESTTEDGREVGGGELAGVCVGEITSPGLV